MPITCYFDTYLKEDYGGEHRSDQYLREIKALLGTCLSSVKTASLCLTDKQIECSQEIIKALNDISILDRVSNVYRLDEDGELCWPGFNWYHETLPITLQIVNIQIAAAQKDAALAPILKILQETKTSLEKRCLPWIQIKTFSELRAWLESIKEKDIIKNKYQNIASHISEILSAYDDSISYYERDFQGQMGYAESTLEQWKKGLLSNYTDHFKEFFNALVKLDEDLAGFAKSNSHNELVTIVKEFENELAVAKRWIHQDSTQNLQQKADNFVMEKLILLEKEQDIEVFNNRYLEAERKAEVETELMQRRIEERREEVERKAKVETELMQRQIEERRESEREACLWKVRIELGAAENVKKSEKAERVSQTKNIVEQAFNKTLPFYSALITGNKQSEIPQTSEDLSEAVSMLLAQCILYRVESSHNDNTSLYRKHPHLRARFKLLQDKIHSDCLDVFVKSLLESTQHDIRTIIAFVQQFSRWIGKTSKDLYKDMPDITSQGAIQKNSNPNKLVLEINTIGLSPLSIRLAAIQKSKVAARQVCAHYLSTDPSCTVGNLWQTLLEMEAITNPELLEDAKFNNLKYLRRADNPVAKGSSQVLGLFSNKQVEFYQTTRTYGGIVRAIKYRLLSLLRTTPYQLDNDQFTELLRLMNLPTEAGANCVISSAEIYRLSELGLLSISTSQPTSTEPSAPPYDEVSPPGDTKGCSLYPPSYSSSNND